MTISPFLLEQLVPHIARARSGLLAAPNAAKQAAPYAKQGLLADPSMQPPQAQAAAPVPMPALPPQSAPAPAQVQQAPEAPKTLLQRIMGVPGAVREAVRDIAAPVPPGMEQMLTPEEIERARPGVFQSLFNTASMEGNAGSILGAREQQRVRGARDMIAQRHPAMQGETSRATLDRLTRMYADYAQVGDIEMVQKTGEVLKSIGGEGTQASIKEIDAGDHIELVNPHTGEMLRWIPKPTAGGAPYDLSTPQGMRLFSAEQQLADDYFNATKEYATVSRQLATIESTREAAKAGNAPAQMALIFAYMKMLDPTSAVRETEYANAENARGVPETVRNAYNRVMSGSILVPTQVEGFISQAERQRDEWAGKLSSQQDYYSRRARAWGIQPDRVVFDYFGTRRRRTPAAESTPPGAADYDRFFPKP